MTTAQRQKISAGWILLHFGPLMLVPMVTHPLHRIIGITPAAAVAHILIVVGIAIGEAYLLRAILPRPRRWAWQSMCAVAAAVVAGLVVMSTVDLAGYDAAATFSGMGAAGFALGLVQSPAQPLGTIRWVLPIVIGWVVAALVFRAVIPALAGMSIGGVAPFGLAYNAGHNELLWFSVGLAFHGVATAWSIVELAKVGRAPLSP